MVFGSALDIYDQVVLELLIALSFLLFILSCSFHQVPPCHYFFFSVCLIKTHNCFQCISCGSEFEGWKAGANQIKERVRKGTWLQYFSVSVHVLHQQCIACNGFICIYVTFSCLTELMDIATGHSLLSFKTRPSGSVSTDGCVNWHCLAHCFTSL